MPRLIALLLGLSLAAPAQPRSLPVAICYEGHPQERVECLRGAFERALENLIEATSSATIRLDLPAASTWVATTNKVCGLPPSASLTDPDLPDNTNFECLIERTIERSRQLREVGREPIR